MSILQLTQPAVPERTACPGVLAAVGVSRRYGEGDAHVDALSRVSLEIETGRLTAIMGPSGSGKSTLMHILAGLDQPSSGSVWIDGRRVDGLDVQVALQQIKSRSPNLVPVRISSRRKHRDNRK